MSRIKVISFVNMKGGVGKTTVTVNIAYTLAQRFEKRVLVIDLDPQFNATQCFLAGEDYVNIRRQGTRTISAVFEENEQYVPDIVNGNVNVNPELNVNDLIYRYNDNIHLILGDLDLYRLEFSQGMAREKRLLRLMEQDFFQQNYDYVLIDCPPTPSIWMISGLLSSQYYIIPVKPEPLSRYGIDIFTGIINRVLGNHGLTVDCAGIILTMSENGTLVYRDTRQYLENSEQWRNKLFQHELLKRTAIPNAQADQDFIYNISEELKRMIVEITREFERKVS